MKAANITPRWSNSIPSTSCRHGRATARLYLLCFAYYRFRQINDNLIEAFIHLVDHYEQQAKQAAEDAMQRTVTEASEHLQAAGQVRSLFVDASIPGDAPFTVVQQQAFALLDPLPAGHRLPAQHGVRQGRL